MGELISNGTVCPDCGELMEHWKSSYHVDGCQRYIFGYSCNCGSEYTESEMKILELEKDILEFREEK